MAVIILHRPVCILISSYYCHWYCICSCRYALRRTARRRGPAQPARHDSTQNSSLHARTPKALKPPRPAALRGGHLQG